MGVKARRQPSTETWVMYPLLTPTARKMSIKMKESFQNTCGPGSIQTSWLFRYRLYYLLRCPILNIIFSPVGMVFAV